MTKLEGAMDVNSESEICENVEKFIKSARVKHSITTNKNNLEQTYRRGVVIAAAGITLINVALLVGLCEKISVKSKTVIKTMRGSGLKNSRSDFLQCTTDTVICQGSVDISLME